MVVVDFDQFRLRPEFSFDFGQFFDVDISTKRESEKKQKKQAKREKTK